MSVLWIVGSLTVGWFLWPSSLGGCTTLTIVSGHSMEPTYFTGDLVVSRCGPVEVGDVIVYNPPNIEGARVIHRVIGGDTDEGLVVQGDNNSFIDPWSPRSENVLGTAVLHLPHVGTFASILLSPLTWVSLLIVALAVVIWPGRDPQDGETEQQDGETEEQDGEMEEQDGEMEEQDGETGSTDGEAAEADLPELWTPEPEEAEVTR